ncbi:hypothetical protein HAX54_036196 [Datura stramonium]|uniref:Uncharacterized protein n=1 Tax=Datura stramonium TaxID=4076 RepID=A0ABS8SFY1_DATST|nr:hypothetical protein [Datura stramonium]
MTVRRCGEGLVTEEPPILRSYKDGEDETGYSYDEKGHVRSSRAIANSKELKLALRTISLQLIQMVQPEEGVSTMFTQDVYEEISGMPYGPEKRIMNEDMPELWQFEDVESMGDPTFKGENGGVLKGGRRDQNKELYMSSTKTPKWKGAKELKNWHEFDVKFGDEGEVVGGRYLTVVINEDKHYLIEHRGLNNSEARRILNSLIRSWKAEFGMGTHHK